MTLSERMQEAANTIQEFNTRYDFGEHMPWEPGTLRNAAKIVAAEETESSPA